MTPAEEQKLKYHLRQAAKILKEDTPEEELQDTTWKVVEKERN